MRRILSACLEQTIRFEDVAGTISSEVEFQQYKLKLERKGTKYEVLDTQIQPDGSLIVKIKRQYNSYKTDGYM